MSRRTFLGNASLIVLAVPLAQRPPAPSAFSAHVPAAWFDLTLELARTTPGFSPPVAARAFAYTAVALHDAIGPRRLSGAPRATALHWPTVANAAMATIVRALFPAPNAQAIDALERHFARSSPAGRRAAAHGRRVARHVFAWSETDGYRRTTAPYTPPQGAVGRTLTPEQTAIARFWSDDPGLTATPGGHSLRIATQAIRDLNAPLDVAAEAYANVTIAVSDAFISCWRTKFRHNLLRPVTYIQRVIDPAWMPLLTTPPFPEYTSGHSVQSMAAAEVLTDLFGRHRFTDGTRSFTSFRAAAREAAISRLYGGIHYRSAIERGLEEGACVARRVRAKLRA
jgi:hypothetical protein